VWLTFLPYLDSWWKLLVWVGVHLVWWALLTMAVFFSTGISRVKHIISFVFFLVGAVSYIVFIDHEFTRTIVKVLTICIPVLNLWLLPSTDQELSFALKPERRWRFFMVVLGLAGLWSGVIAGRAFGVYFFNIGWLVLALALVMGAVSAWWWWEYSAPLGQRFYLSVAATTLVALEAGWAVTVSPLGFFAGSFLIVWLWYVLWLLLRFHLSSEGVLWRKQWPFLALNALAITLFVATIVRWK
jgi:hypothetical protein